MHDWLHVVNTISHVQVDNLRAALIKSREEVATLQASFTTFESSHDTAAKVLGDAEERVACLEQHRTQQDTELDAARAQRCDLFWDVFIGSISEGAHKAPLRVAPPKWACCLDLLGKKVKRHLSL